MRFCNRPFGTTAGKRMDARHRYAGNSAWEPAGAGQRRRATPGPSGCTERRAALYVGEALDKDEERAYELHYMECERCLRYVEEARHASIHSRRENAA